MVRESIFRLIVVPVDSSPNAMRAAEIAINMCREFGSHLVAVAVVDSGVIYDLSERMEMGRKVLQAEKELERDAEKTLDMVEKMARGYKVSVEKVKRKGKPHLEIIGLATELKASLIIMGKGARKAGSRLVLSNITERVIEDADCSVMLVA
jgi:nucleotide-binding universal stress UspA family protein